MFFSRSISFMMILAILFGLLIGSFANVCILRLPKDLSLWRPGSHCPGCQRPLRWFENIPVFSFVWLKAKCRTCKVPISWQYPLIELAMAALFAVCQWHYRGDVLKIFLGWTLSFYLLTISIIDIRHKIIPDELSLSLLAFGICFGYFNPMMPVSGWHGFAQSLLAAVGGGLFMMAVAWIGEKIFKKEALGGGDVKLIAAFGAVLGWHGLTLP